MFKYLNTHYNIYTYIIMSVTLFITACNRPDLLKQTLESFLKYNTYPITKCIIVEDSDKININDFAIEMCPFPVEIIYNNKNIGQLESIEIGYSKIDTEYIFHCEDDWEFFKPGFIEISKNILDRDSSVVTVWLRAHNDTSCHPIEQIDRGGYKYMITNFGKLWHGFTLNPGLRRLADYKKFAPWKETCYPYIEGFGVLNEPDLSVLYYKNGYRGAITNDPEGLVRHIGWGRHIKRFFEK
jgi:hypothetical protein